MLLRTLQICMLFVCFASHPSAHAQNNKDPWAIWKQEGVHAIMRHATAPGFGDPDHFRVGDCNTQRNLNETGRREARALGRQIREQGIQPTAVYSSQWCRCKQTADEMRLGEVQELPALNSFFEGRGNGQAQTAALKNHIAALGPKDKVLYVTHQVNTTSLTGIYPSPGEVVLFQLSPSGDIEVLGTIKID